MSPKTRKGSSKTPPKTLKRKDAPAAIVSPPSKRGRVEKNGSKVKTPTRPKCQPGGLLLNWPPDDPKMLATNTCDSSVRVNEIKATTKEDSGILSHSAINESSAFPTVVCQQSPTPNFSGASSASQEVVVWKKNIAEALAPLQVVPLVQVVHRNGKQVRRVQPILVTGNTPPPSPKLRPTLPYLSAPDQSSTKKPEPQFDLRSTFLSTKDTPVYKSPYAPLPNSRLVEKSVAENVHAPRLPTPPQQSQQEEQGTSSQCPSNRKSHPQASSSRSTPSLPYRRKALPPNHFPGGMGARIRDKPLPKSISKPTPQDILNVITPGAQRRPWDQPARVRDAKALEIIEEIFRVKALEGATVYDFLRLSVYRSWEEHKGNYGKLVQCLQKEFAVGGRAVLAVNCKRTPFRFIVELQY